MSIKSISTCKLHVLRYLTFNNPFSIHQWSSSILIAAQQDHGHSFDISAVTNLVEAYNAVMFCGNLDVCENLVVQQPIIY